MSRINKNKNMYSIKNHYLISGFVLMLGFIMLIPSCNSEGGRLRSREVSFQNFLSEDDIFDDIDRAKRIFYSLPSPLETAMMLKNEGVGFNESLLNDVNKASRYVTSKSKALNLGIYTTDLSLASLFDQAQTALSYMNVTKTIAEEMGINDAIDNETLQRLEQNLNNREVVMDIISETFLNTSSYLKENEQQDLAAIVLVGGWIEGLYLGTQMVGDNPVPGDQLVDRLAEQKLSFSIVERMLEENRTDVQGNVNQDIVELINELADLKIAFDNIDVQTSAVTVDQIEESDVALLRSQTKLNYSTDDFLQFINAVNLLRNKFVQ